MRNVLSTLRFSVIVVLLAFSMTTIAQDDLLNEVMNQQDSAVDLLPKKMLFTQRIFWGEHGLMRSVSPLTNINREKELKLRRGMLVTHQVLGFATLGGMVAQGIVGTKLYNQGGRKLNELHEGLAVAVNLTYSTTAVMSLFTPPPLINRDKKISAIRVHKWLAAVHLTGMVATNVLSGLMEDNPNLRPYHRAAAFATFASFGAAVIAIKF